MSKKSVANKIMKRLRNDNLYYLHSKLLSKNWNQRDLADIMGVQESYVSKILNGTKPVTFKTAFVLGAIFGCEPSRFLKVSEAEVKKAQEAVKKAAKFAA